MRRVTLEPLTAEAFAPFGQVLQTPGSVPRLDRAAALDNGRAGASANLALVRAEPRALPLAVELMERHPQSSQAFLPLDARRYLVLVCPDTGDGRPDMDHARAFAAERHQAINYDTGTWHHPMTALDGPATFAVLIWEDGTDGDCTFHPLPEAARITVVE